jgi:hypothetical protein
MRWAAMRRFGWWEIGHLGLHFVGHVGHGGGPGGAEIVVDRATVFEFGGLCDRQRDYIDWVLKNSVEEGLAPEDVITDAAATRLAAKLKTPLQIGGAPGARV